MLEHNNIVIFSPPRSGTKLLANILENLGYFSHGEWFAPLTTKIENNKGVRRDIYLKEIWSTSERQFKNLNEHVHRLELYEKVHKSVVTIWPEYMLEFPFMLYKFADYHWACIRRDPWQQMLSYYISSKNDNFDGIKISKSVTFNEPAFRKMYWDYYKICGLQDWLIENQSATLIDFEDLIHGKSTVLGHSYKVESKDEHADLELLVENLDQVKTWYATFENNRNNGQV